MAAALGSRHLQREGDVLLGGAVAQEAEVLEDDAHLAAQHGDVALADELGREAGDAHLAPDGMSAIWMRRMTVLFPAPEWPVRKTSSPLRTWNDTSRSAAPSARTPWIRMKA
jgi:hypothetical protein